MSGRAAVIWKRDGAKPREDPAPRNYKRGRLAPSIFVFVPAIISAFFSKCQVRFSSPLTIETKTRFIQKLTFMKMIGTFKAIAPAWEPVPLTLHEALSGLLGSISIACWIFLLVPQVLENHRNRSASALSLPFVLIWLLGDICNLVGAVWASLVPTVVAIGIYFVIADSILLAQCLYYRRRNSKPDSSDIGTAGADDSRSDDGENEPLLSRSSERSHPAVASDNETLLASEPKVSNSNPWLRNVVSVTLVFIVGTLGWAAAWRTGAWRPPIEPGNETGVNAIESAEGPLGAQILGYASAVLYLGARIPQIIKNAREKSCEGLALLFFLLSLLGNVTYGGGILFHSLERSYVITNIPWLIGSFGTMAEDCIIFAQFRIYGERARKDAEDDGFHEAGFDE